MGSKLQRVMCEVLACKCEMQTCRFVSRSLHLRLWFWFGIWGPKDCGLCRSWCLGFDVLPLLGSCISGFCLYIHYTSLLLDFIHPRYYFLINDVLGPWGGYFIGIQGFAKSGTITLAWLTGQCKSFSTCGPCAFRCHCGVPRKVCTYAGLSDCNSLLQTPYDLK